MSQPLQGFFDGPEVADVQRGVRYLAQALTQMRRGKVADWKHDVKALQPRLQGARKLIAVGALLVGLVEHPLAPAVGEKA